MREGTAYPSGITVPQAYFGTADISAFYVSGAHISSLYVSRFYFSTSTRTRLIPMLRRPI